jgi:hypothetical protein
MADCRTDDTVQTRRAAAFGECARGAERDLLHPVDRLLMELPKDPPPKSTVRDYLEL